MMQGKPREARRTVRLAALLRDANGWNSVTICNISSRGMMLECVTPIAKHTFVEIRCRNLVVAGQIRWSNGVRCGVRTQDRIDLAALLSEADLRGRMPAGNREVTTRRDAHMPDSAGIVQQSARSTRWARAIDWLAVAVTGTVLAALAADGMFRALSTPLGAVRAALRAADQ